MPIRSTAWMHNVHDADDVFQEVFLRYVEKAPAFQSEEHRKARLLRVTINCCKSHYRAAWYRRVLPVADVARIPMPEAENADLADALERLSPKARTVIHLHYFEGMDTAQIARATGQVSSTVRSALSRARTTLKKQLEGAWNE